MFRNSFFSQPFSIFFNNKVQNESMYITTPSRPFAPMPMEAKQTLSTNVDSSSLNIPSGMSLAAIDPSLIAEVRQEFLSNQQQQQGQNNYMSVQKEESYHPQPPKAESYPSMIYDHEPYQPEEYDPEAYQPDAYNPEAHQPETYYSFEEEEPDNSLDLLLDSLRNTTKVTPQVLEALGRMCRETDLLSVLRECQHSQV